MKHLKLVSLLVLSVVATSIFGMIPPVDDRDTFGKSFFSARSQGSNTAREITGLPRFIFTDCECPYTGIVAATPAYSSSFDRTSIGKFIFFNGTDTMQTGTAAGPFVDIFGENFLVNDDFNGAVTAKPSAKNGIVDFAAWWMTDAIGCGMYAIIHAPIVWTKWKVDLTETRETAGEFIVADQLGNTNDEPAPFDSMVTAWNGDATFFDVQQPLKAARINGSQHKFGVADVEAALGYVFVNDECNFISVNLRAIFPTGTRPDGEFLFEPVIGGGRHWQFGFGVMGNYELWNNNCDQTLNAFVYGNFYTIFAARQRRTFDLKDNGIGSRYLLFKRFNEDGTYAGEIVRGPNILTLNCDVHNKATGDATFMLDYINKAWDLNLGYNVWGRSRDKITVTGKIPPDTYGVAGSSGTGGNAGRTASRTTISGENAGILDDLPVLITNNDINVDSARHPGTISHAVFGFASYTFGCALQPFLGLGLQLEFSGTNNRAFRMWHVWGKFGLAF